MYRIVHEHTVEQRCQKSAQNACESCFQQSGKMRLQNGDVSHRALVQNQDVYLICEEPSQAVNVSLTEDAIVTSSIPAYEIPYPLSGNAD